MDTWINFGEGFLLVFAINDEESFKALINKRDRILQIKNGKVCPILLIGNKHSQAKELANKWGCEYIETSAETNFNCKEAFEILAKKIIQIKRNELKKKKKGCCC